MKDITEFLVYFCGIVSFISFFFPEGQPNTWALWSIMLLLLMTYYNRGNP